jgi:NADPH:quinone reductase-like Zn-dependent oxidoreductase
MRAIVQERYGPPEVLEIREVERPAPLAEQVLVRVHASSVNAGDWHRARGRPLFSRAISGLRRPKTPGLGWDVAGVVESVGTKVTSFQPGDEVFGQTIKTFAEYVRVSHDAIAPKPAGMTFEAAAAVPVAALTSLQGLRDHGHLEAGQSVLIDGASGGCGTFAVQLAKAFGARVTAVTSTPTVDFVRSMGADRVIDRTREDWSRDERYDLVLDVGGFASIADLRRPLAPTGRVVLVGAGHLNSAQLLVRLYQARQLRGAKERPVAFFITKRSKSDLLLLKEMLEAGRIWPVIDRCYSLEQIPAAVRQVEEGRARGKVVIKVV